MIRLCLIVVLSLRVVCQVHNADIDLIVGSLSSRHYTIEIRSAIGYACIDLLFPVGRSPGTSDRLLVAIHMRSYVLIS